MQFVPNYQALCVVSEQGDQIKIMFFDVNVQVDFDLFKCEFYIDLQGEDFKI